MRHGHRVLMAGLVGVALAVVLAWSAPGGQDSLAMGTTIHVDAGATGNNNGSIWQHASTDDGTATVDPDVAVAVSLRVYLPLIVKFTTATCEEGIVNGGFEVDGGWEIPVTAYRAAYSTAEAHGGSRSMRVGIVDASENRYSYSSVRQLVAIPADADSVTLGFWLYTLSGEADTRAVAVPERPLASSVEEATLADDAQYVLILDGNDVWIDTVLWQRRDDRAWTYFEADLLGYAGQTIKLQFGVYNDGVGGATGMYVDDVSLVACTTPAPNQPPHVPSAPTPSDGATGQPTLLTLSWLGDDPDGDAVTYDVKLDPGDDTPETLVCDDVTSPGCDPGLLVTGTHYYWQVVATDEHSATTLGPVWEFTTTLATCEEGIVNGGFEVDGGWEIPVTAYRAAYSTAEAHGGSRSMRVGIVKASENRYSYSSVRQLVTLPADADSVTLGFWLYSLSGEADTRAVAVPERPLASSVEEAALADDAQYVLILDENDVWIDTVLWQRRDDQAWTYHEADLMGYAGQTIKLQFGVYNDGVGGATGMYVDDVSLVACTTPAPNQPPHVPSSPTPSDGATGQPTTLTLSWLGGDPDGDAVTYDLKLDPGDDTPETLVCDDVSSPGCDPGLLVTGTHYYWQVVATDEHSATTVGPVWEFTTTLATCEEGIVNGDFEADGGWEIPVTAYRAAYSTAEAHGGSRSMRVGIVDASENRYSYSSVRQLVAIPADADSVTLGFWLYTLSGEADTRAVAVPERPLAPSVEEAALADDAQYVLILDGNDVWIDTVLWQRRDDRAWTYHAADLLGYAGQAIKLQFGVYNDGVGGATGMYVDDVSLVHCSP